MGLTTLTYSAIFEKGTMIIRCELKSATLLLKPKILKVIIKSVLVHHTTDIDIRYLA